MNYKINKDIISSPWSALILIIVTTIIIYSNIYNAPFVFDDAHSIVENEGIRDLSNYFSFKQILGQRNIVFFTFAINYKLWGLNVIGYHITNVLIHIVNGFLVYLLSLTIFKRIYTIPQSLNSKISLSPFYKRSLTRSEIGLMSLFAALIFVAHPIQTQAVTYIVQRMASMAAMFYMASVFFYLKARVNAQNPKLKAQRGFYVLSGFCGMLAFLSKENAASLPGAIILVEYLFIDRTWKNWKKMIPWFVLSFALWVVFVSYIMGLLGVFGSGSGSGELLEKVSDHLDAGLSVSRWEYLCTQFNVLVIYIRLLFLPIHQCLDYLYPYKEGFFDGYTPVTFLFLVGLVGVGVWSISKRPIISLAVFWFFITLSVESSIFPLHAYYEHRLYLPTFGFAIFAAWLLFYFLPADGNSRRRSWVIVSYVIIIILLGTATYHRNMVWQDEIKLWYDAVSKSPKNYRAQYILGNALSKQDMFDKAIYHFKESLRLEPDDHYTHNNLGNALSKQGKLDEAIHHYKESLRINPDHASAYTNLGNALSRQGKHEDAILHYKEALRLGPNHAEAHNNLGLTLCKEGKLNEAVFHYKEALRIKPDSAAIHNNLGLALYKEGQFNEAISYFKESLRIKPDDASVHNSLGTALAQQDKHEEAILHFKKALRLKPNYTDVHNNLGLVLARQDKHEDAILHYKEALRLGPDHVEAHNNLGLILEQQGMLEKAVFHFKEALRIGPESTNISNRLQSVLTSLDNAKKHFDKGLALESKGLFEEAIYHYKESSRINPYDAKSYNNLSWVLATSANPSFRDAAKAVELAEKACKLTMHKQPLMLDTLAAAYAGVGRFDKALQVAQKAIEIARSNGQAELAGIIEKRMQLYKSGRPLYEDTLTTKP